MYSKSVQLGRLVPKETRHKIGKVLKERGKEKLKDQHKEKISNGLLNHYLDIKNREKCFRKNEENRMTTGCKIIFPLGKEKEFSMLKLAYQYLKETYGLSKSKSQYFFIVVKFGLIYYVKRLDI